MAEHPTFLLFTLALGVLIVLAFLLIPRLAIFASPHRIQIISGRKSPDEKRDYRLHRKGFALRIPFVEQAHSLDTTLLPVEVRHLKIQTADGAEFALDLDAFVSVDRHSDRVHAAIDQFLGQDREEMIQVVKASIEELIPGATASLSTEEIQRDRLAFDMTATAAVDAELNEIGMILQSLHLQKCTLLTAPQSTAEPELATDAQW